jgi:hypothetical protein
MDEIRTAVASWYPLPEGGARAAALWSFGTAVAWVFYLEPALPRAASRPTTVRRATSAWCGITRPSCT